MNSQEKTFETIAKLKDIELELLRLRNALDMANKIIDAQDARNFGEQPGMQFGLNQDDWKDIVAAISKVRDGRDIFLGCRPADVFQDWFLAMGLFKPKEKNND
jgi:hypothetical protein